MRELRGESWRARASKPKEKVQAPGVGLTARGADLVVAHKAQTHCPRLAGLVSGFEVRCLDTYELLNKSD